MTNRKLRWAAILAGALSVLIGFPAYLALTTFPHSGDKAIPRMSESERALLAKLQTISEGMPYSEVVAILGQPDREALGLRPTWRVEGSPFNQVAVYLSGGTVRRIRWMKLGGFVWEQPSAKSAPASRNRSAGPGTAAAP